MLGALPIQLSLLAWILLMFELQSILVSKAKNNEILQIILHSDYNAMTNTYSNTQTSHYHMIT